MGGSTSGEREGLLGRLASGVAIYWPDEGNFYLLAMGAVKGGSSLGLTADVRCSAYGSGCGL
jgi:hypothetical protein